jgi:uncharacterized membrane protein
MNFTVAGFPASWLWACGGLLAAFAVDVALHARWRSLLDTTRLNLWLGTIVALMVLWSIHAGLRPGLDFHLLGASACALMFGARLGLTAIGAVVLGSAAAGSLEWASLPLNLLIMGATPVLVSTAVLRAVERWLPSHFFVYIFGVAFFGAAAAMVASGCVACALLALSGRFTPEFLLSEYLPWYLLMAWAEAFLTGAAITLMVVYRPGWVITFDDRRYLRDQ